MIKVAGDSGGRGLPVHHPIVQSLLPNGAGLLSCWACAVAWRPNGCWIRHRTCGCSCHALVRLFFSACTSTTLGERRLVGNTVSGLPAADADVSMAWQNCANHSVKAVSIGNCRMLHLISRDSLNCRSISTSFELIFFRCRIIPERHPLSTVVA